MAETVSIISSNGDSNNIGFIIDSTGAILERRGEFETDQDDRERIASFDVAEYVQTYGHLDGSVDILDIGYWTQTGKYEPPESHFRMNTLADQEQPILSSEVVTS